LKFGVQVDLLIFDMDGVLIDVSRSYRKTIQRTVKTYLEVCLGFKRIRKDWVTNEEISILKSAGGFNSDWDVTSGFLLYLLSVSGIPPVSKRKQLSSIEEILNYLKSNSPAAAGKSPVIRKNHLLAFSEKVRSAGGGLKGVRRVLKHSWEGWVYLTGDLNRDNLVERIFQEIYLGKQFTSYYRLPCIFYKRGGLYLQEKLMIPRRILSSLRKNLKMGIASGRLRYEAELGLRRFHLDSYFDSIVTLDECEEEEKRIFRSTGKQLQCSKPNSYSIMRVVREIGIPNPHCGYVGDVVDDMVAARAAAKNLPVLAIGFVGGHPDKKSAKESLLRAGADVIIQKAEELLCFTGGGKGFDCKMQSAK
jgi:HAD superfamily hydrolase (TIGR01548 family)